MQEPKHSEVGEKQFFSKPTAKRPKLTEGEHKSKFDLSYYSKFLDWKPLNSASVSGITAVTFLICALEILLTLYSVSLTIKDFLATHTRSIIFCTFWFLVTISGTVLAMSTFLCIRSSSLFYMQIWLILTSLTWFGQFHAAAVISKDHKAIQPNGQNWDLNITARHLMFHNSRLCQQLWKHHYNPSVLQPSQIQNFQGQNP